MGRFECRENVKNVENPDFDIDLHFSRKKIIIIKPFHHKRKKFSRSLTIMCTPIFNQVLCIENAHSEDS